MNLLYMIPCIFLLGALSLETASITTAERKALPQVIVEETSDAQIHSVKKRNADPFFHRLFGFGRNRYRRPKHHKEVHLHVVHPPKYHNEIHHGGGQESFDFEPPSWFEADEYGNPHQEGHFNYGGFGPWNEEVSLHKPHEGSHDTPHKGSHEIIHVSSHEIPHHGSHEEGPHFGKPYSTLENHHEGDHLPPIHIDPHESHLRPPPPPHKRPPKLLHNDFHPSPLVEEINFKPLMVHHSHDSNEFLPKPPSPIHLPPSNYIDIPHSKQKLKKIANNSIYRGDYPKRDKFNPFDKITSGLDPAGVKGVDPDTMAFIRDKIIPLANAKR